MQYKKEQSDLLTHKNKATQHHEWGFLTMKRNAKTIIAGMIALAISHTAMADDIKVAVVGAMSGPIAQWGDMEFNGARQAIKDINAKGGIKGDKLVGVEYDDACDPKQAVAVANKIVNDGIKYVIGHLCSSSTQPASDIYEDEGILMISPGATNPELTQRGYQYIMRTAGLDSSQGPTAAKYILETVKPQRIAIIHDKQQYGEGLARSVQDGLKAANANVVFFDGITAGEKDFSALIQQAKHCAPPVELETGEIVGGFAHAQVLALADKIVEAVKSGAIKKFVVMAGCDGRAKSRSYYSDFARALPKDTVILTAGCAKYKYNKLDLGDINGIPRVLDAGQCNDSYSLAVIALKLKEIFGLEDINDLPIIYNISWYEQKAVIVLLALLSLGVKNIHLGPTLPAFLSPNVAKVLVDTFGIAGIDTVENDIKLFFGEQND